MKAEDIRKLNVIGDGSVHAMNGARMFLLQEIAAQLAELNAQLSDVTAVNLQGDHSLIVKVEKE
jgi:hypothetical protein